MLCTEVFLNLRHAQGHQYAGQKVQAVTSVINQLVGGLCPSKLTPFSLSSKSSLDVHLILFLLCRCTPEVLTALSETALAEMLEDLSVLQATNEEESATEPCKKLAFECALMALRAPTQAAGLRCQIEFHMSMHTKLQSCSKGYAIYSSSHCCTKAQCGLRLKCNMR